MKATLTGGHAEFLSSGRLDDLQCVYSGVKAICLAKPSKAAAVCAVLDNEEVGSTTKHGAASTFLKDVLARINGSFGYGAEDQIRFLSQSFMVSADNVHAMHPNFPEKSDTGNHPVLNEGVVIKYSANQKYTTDAVTGALFKVLCEHAKVPVQVFVNRSDMLGGSTLGNISNTQVSIPTVDIGAPQLAMHSAYETCGARDTVYLVKAARELFSSHLELTGEGIRI